MNGKKTLIFSLFWGEFQEYRKIISHFIAIFVSDLFYWCYNFKKST